MKIEDLTVYNFKSLGARATSTTYGDGSRTVNEASIMFRDYVSNRVSGVILIERSEAIKLIQTLKQVFDI